MEEKALKSKKRVFWILYFGNEIMFRLNDNGMNRMKIDS